MSELIRFEASGVRDFCSITPEEIVRFCIDNDVDRINSMCNLWEVTMTDKDGLISKSLVDREEAIKIRDETKAPCRAEISTTTSWDIDVN